MMSKGKDSGEKKVRKKTMNNRRCTMTLHSDNERDLCDFEGFRLFVHISPNHRSKKKHRSNFEQVAKRCITCVNFLG